MAATGWSVGVGQFTCSSILKPAFYFVPCFSVTLKNNVCKIGVTLLMGVKPRLFLPELRWLLTGNGWLVHWRRELNFLFNLTFYFVFLVVTFSCAQDLFLSLTLHIGITPGRNRETINGVGEKTHVSICRALSLRFSFLILFEVFLVLVRDFD